MASPGKTAAAYMEAYLKSTEEREPSPPPDKMEVPQGQPGVVFHQAAVYSNPALLVEILKGSKRKCINFTDKDGRTALHAACLGEMVETADSIKCVTLLLEAGADPNIVTSEASGKRTPLHIAASTGKYDITEKLVQYGADLDKLDSSGQTPHLLAEENRDLKMVEFFMYKIEERAILRKELERDLLEACSDIDKLMLLLRKLGFSAINCDYKETLLYRATALQNEEVIDFLISRGSEGKANRDTKETPLHLACFRGYFEISVKLLQQFPWMSSELTNDNEVPLHSAAKQGHSKLVRLLLNHDYKALTDQKPLVRDSSKPSTMSKFKASFKSYKGDLPFYIDQCNLNSQTALYLACAAGHTEVVEELLDYQPRNGGGAGSLLPNGSSKPAIKVDTYTVEGRTPLHCAVLCGHIDIVSVLLRHGADPNKPMQSLGHLMAQTPVEEGQHERFVERVHIAPTDSSVLYAAFQRSDSSLEIIRLLLSYGARDIDGKVLLSANLSRNKDVISLLLAYMGVHRDQDSTINEACREKFKRLLLPMVGMKAGRQASGSSTLAKSLKRRKSLNDEHKSSILRRRRTLASIKRPAGMHSSFDTPVTINWHDHNLTDIYKEWLVEASLRFNPALKHLDNIGNCIHDKVSVITRIDISDNCLRNVPLLIFQLPSLQMLNLSNNKLVHLPVDGPERIPEENGDEEASIVGWKLPCLKEFKLDGNRISSVPLDVFKLPSLEVLTLVGNTLKELPYDMWRAPSLRVLNVSKNNLKELPMHATDIDDVFPMESSMDTLRMDYSLPNGGRTSDSESENAYLAMDEREHYVEMHNNSYLNGRDCEDNVKSQSGNVAFGNFKRHQLCSSSSMVSLAIEEKPTSEEICNLRELDLSHNEFEEVPPGLACLAPRLAKLVLSKNKIKNCGPINRFPAGLVDLYMSNNQVSQITNSSRKLSCNQKSSKFMLFRGVHQTDENSNRTDLCYSPFCVVQSTTPSSGAKHISLDSSSLLPSSTKTSQPPKSYYCQHQRHRVLANLVTLELSHNRLPSLVIATTSSSSSPPSPVEGKDDVLTSGEGDPNSSPGKSSQQLQEMSSSEIYLLFPSLKVLSVSSNNLSCIPADIQYFSRLNSLKIDRNDQIREFPPEMGRLKNLIQLEFDGCPVRDDYGRDMRVSDILSYLDSILEDAKPYNRMKLMFVGKSDIGKTTLLNELRKDTAVFGRHPSEILPSFAERAGSPNVGGKTLKGNYLSTVGVDVGEWTYCKKRGGKKVTFSTWDFGGQNEFYVTHQYFLTKRSIYLVIFKITDGRRCLSELQQWLVNIQARAPNSPVILVGTHYDVLHQNKKYSREFWPDLKKLIEDRFVVDSPQDMGLPNVHCCVEISCTAAGKYHNLNNLREKIYDVAFTMKESKRIKDKGTLLDKKIPTSYLALENAIRTIVGNMKRDSREPVMNTTEYKTEVARVMVEESEVSFHNKEELMLATKFLHNNGVLLYFEDALLSDYFFLDPQWLCDILAKIVTIPEINPEARQGVMLIRDLEQKFINSNVNAFIRGLLNKFEVAVEYDNQHLLIPSLLPKRNDAISIQMVRNPQSDNHIDEQVLEGEGIIQISSTRKTPEPLTSATSVPQPLSSAVSWNRKALKKFTGISTKITKGEKEDTSSPLPPLVPPGRHGNRYSSPAAMLVEDVEDSFDHSDAASSISSPPLHSPKLSSSTQTIDNSSEWTKVSPLDISLLTPQKETPVVKPSVFEDFKITTFKIRKLPLRRLYIFQYIPSGFWSHIMCRFLSNEQIMQVVRAMFEPKKEVQSFLGEEAVSDLPNQYKWQCWQTGMELKFFDTTIFHIMQITDTITNSFTKERRPDMIYMVNLTQGNDFAQSEVSLMRIGQVEILIPNQAVQISRKDCTSRRERTVRMEKSSEHVSQLLSLIMDLVEMLIDNFYPTLCEPLGTTFHGELFITRVVPCCKCWKEYNKTLCNDVNDKEWVFIDNSDSDYQYFLEEDSLLMGSFHRKKQTPICCAIPCVSPKHKRYAQMGMQNGVNLQPPSRPVSVNNPKGCNHRFNNGESSSVPMINSALEAKENTPLLPLARSLTEVDEASFEESFNENHFSASEEIIASSSVKVYGFLLEELIYEGMRSQTTECPRHGELPITTLAPDVVFHDLGQGILVDDAQLEKKRLLGRGSFGLVFEGKVCSEDGSKTAVALKMLQPYPPGEGARRTDRHRYEMENSKWQRFPIRFACEAYRTVRKELSILMKLSHVSIVPLKGMCHHPLCLILELAPMGALDNFLEDYKRGGARLTATTIANVVTQISGAVEYLHHNKIIYRDLKAENVLVWTFPEPHSSELEPNDLKVKLADYGISTTALPTGTKGFGGTPGFMAPEIVKYDGKETYTEKVDCFSFGMFMYELLSLQKPFDSAIGQGVGRLAQVIKHYIIEGQRPPLSHKEKAYPTYILDLMLWCWSQEPRNRPSMQQVKEVARLSEFKSLLDVFSVDHGVSIRDACLLELSYEGASTSVLCMSQNTSESSSKLSLFPLERLPGDESTSLEVTISGSVVQCICSVGDMLWLALASGYIKVYKVKYRGESCQEVVEYYCHQSHSKSHSITGMRHIPPLQMVAIAADNQLILQRESEGLPSEEAGSFQYVEMVGEITALAVSNHKESSIQVWCGHEGGQVTVVEADNLAQPAQVLSHFEESNLVASVQHLVTDPSSSPPCVWSSVYPDAIVYQWNAKTKEIENKFDIMEVLQNQRTTRNGKMINFRRNSGVTSPVTSYQVSAMCLQNQILYVGIKCGLLILIDVATRDALHVINCHQGAVDFILGYPRDNFFDDGSPVATDAIDDPVPRKQTNSGLITVGKRFADIFSSYGNAPTRLQDNEWDAVFLLLWNTQPWEVSRSLEIRESDC